MNLMDLPEDVIGLIMSPRYIDLLGCTVVSRVCKRLESNTTIREHKSSVCGAAAAAGYLEVLKWAYENNYQIGSAIICRSIDNGHLNTTRWLHKNGHGSGDIRQSYINAIVRGHFDMVKWLHKKKYSTPHFACSYAIANDRFSILKWLLENGMNWYGYLCERAIRYNRTDVLVWVHENGYQKKSTDGLFCEIAAAYGHLEILKVLRGYGHPIKCSSMTSAAYNHHFEVLEWLNENGCPWDEETYNTAVNGDDTEIIEWLESHATPRNPYVYSIVMSKVA